MLNRRAFVSLYSSFASLPLVPKHWAFDIHALGLFSWSCTQQCIIFQCLAVTLIYQDAPHHFSSWLFPFIPDLNVAVPEHSNSIQSNPSGSSEVVCVRVIEP